jgi:hypothetical protein
VCQRFDDRDVREQFDWNCVALLQVGRRVVRDPNLAVCIFMDQDLQREIERGAGGGEHDGGARLRASEDQELGGRHGHASFCCFAAVIHKSEEGNAFCSQGFGEGLHGLIDGVMAGDAGDAGVEAVGHDHPLWSELEVTIEMALRWRFAMSAKRMRGVGDCSQLMIRITPL